ncbi:MAG: hypothetical protein M1820_005781 [Bogoriella megaspora]|nr:MAG: hypothetical protein M1820_005781 [Bogoriella megaspora]
MDLPEPVHLSARHPDRELNESEQRVYDRTGIVVRYEPLGEWLQRQCGTPDPRGVPIVTSSQESQTILSTPPTSPISPSSRTKSRQQWSILATSQPDGAPHQAETWSHQPMQSPITARIGISNSSSIQRTLLENPPSMEELSKLTQGMPPRRALSVLCTHLELGTPQFKVFPGDTIGGITFCNASVSLPKQISSLPPILGEIKEIVGQDVAKNACATQALTTIKNWLEGLGGEQK